MFGIPGLLYRIHRVFHAVICVDPVFGEVWLGFTYLLLSHSPINVDTVTIAIDIPNATVSSLNNGLSIVVVVVGI